MKYSFSILAASLLASLVSLAAAEPTRPNVVLMFIDDLGYADIGPFGNTQVRTPHLDRMAAEGMKFTSFYATPVCSMSRACLMTGSYNTRVSIPGVLFPRDTTGLHANETTLAEVVKQKGYATCCIGKWHLGWQTEFLPTTQGFDHYFGLPYSNDMGQSNKARGFPPLPLIRGKEVIETEPDQAQLTRRYTEEAVKFIREHKDGPFFVYLPHTMVHFPLASSAGFAGKSNAGQIGDAIEEVDWSVGQILSTLKELRLDENTLVIFTSDNGPAGRAAPPFRGAKGSNFEGGVREPCIMRWPGKIPAGTSCDRIAGNIDVLPTMAKLTGAELAKDRVLDGRDISTLMFDPKAALVRDTHYYFAASSALEAIRQGDWKLFLGPAKPKGKGKGAKQKKVAKGPGALYNLATDLGEAKDLAAANPEMVAKLSAAAKAFSEELTANKRPVGQLAGAK
jgi:arylsulfatase A